VDHDTAQSALAEAWVMGVRYFDTAPHYGIGQSEYWFGEFLRQQPRDAFTLSTKVGRLLVEQDPAGRTDQAFQVPATHRRVWDFSRDGVRRSLEDSLRRWAWIGSTSCISMTPKTTSRKLCDRVTPRWRNYVTRAWSVPLVREWAMPDCLPDWSKRQMLTL
jgi:aryl-alcohol dehydrogenase-like predicted oxidoreductase